MNGLQSNTTIILIPIPTLYILFLHFLRSRRIGVSSGIDKLSHRVIVSEEGSLEPNRVYKPHQIKKLIDIYNQNIKMNNLENL